MNAGAMFVLQAWDKLKNVEKLSKVGFKNFVHDVAYGISRWSRDFNRLCTNIHNCIKQLWRVFTCSESLCCVSEYAGEHEGAHEGHSEGAFGG